jgi:hypothetical protein
MSISVIIHKHTWLTFALQTLPEETVKKWTAVVAESRRHEIMHLEAMWHIYLESLPQVLQHKFAFQKIKIPMFRNYGVGLNSLWDLKLLQRWYLMSSGMWRRIVCRVLCLPLGSCLLSLFFEPEDGSSMFLRNFGKFPTTLHGVISHKTLTPFI